MLQLSSLSHWLMNIDSPAFCVLPGTSYCFFQLVIVQSAIRDSILDFYYPGGSYVIVTILLKKIQWFIQNHGMGYPDQFEGGTERASESLWVLRWRRIYLWSYSKRNVLRTVSKNSRMTSLTNLWVIWEQHILCVSVSHESILIINVQNFTSAFFASDFFFHLK